ncbi:hypothetical protein [Paeniglutamicibacter terrestris]|uniref:Uncharacterized protein n=1 Tax=Paeniglutamicibacter terrestris TaxID=2723403 RepID=A0ABX1G4C0_9MICC|nr:hypothetical protein [Paeniglutamicibacter terrestris]NKG21093.1 hypothetical protein [Paeniglutamicibacter terrestris]
MAASAGTVKVALELTMKQCGGPAVACMDLELPVNVIIQAHKEQRVELIAESFMPALAKAMRTWADEIDAEIAAGH